MICPSILDCPALAPEEGPIEPYDWEKAEKEYKDSLLEIKEEESRKFREIEKLCIKSFKRAQKIQPAEPTPTIYSPTLAETTVTEQNLTFIDPNFNKITSLLWFSHHPNGRFGACENPYTCKFCLKTVNALIKMKVLPSCLCFHDHLPFPVAHKDPQRCYSCYQQFCLIELDVYPFKEDKFSLPSFPFLGEASPRRYDSLDSTSDDDE